LAGADGKVRWFHRQLVAFIVLCGLVVPVAGNATGGQDLLYVQPY
jgi:hypothetical protein